VLTRIIPHGVLLIALVLAITPRASDAAVRTPASCEEDLVQAEITSAADGDTIAIPAGTCTWTTTVTIPATKGIILQGAGIGVTTIVDGMTGAHTLSVLVASGNSVTEVRDITFDANNTIKTGTFAEIFVFGSGLDVFRIHHNEIKNLARRGVQVFADAGLEFSGLIDHNTFHTTAASSVQATNVFGARNFNNAGWTTPQSRPVTMGTNKAVYIEDNTFDFVNDFNDGALDAYGGARYVFRYNTVTGTAPAHHGTDSGSYRGPISFEVYGNVLTSDNGSDRAFFARSGTGVVFNNVYTGNYSAIGIANYRSGGSFTPWGECDGTSTWDQNTASQEGYACFDQPGWIFSEVTNEATGATATKTLTPIYAWGNTKDGAQLDAAVGGGPALPGSRMFTLHLLENREFYNENDAFDGTVGIGRGVLASRPATCTTGVGYWATDQGEWNTTGADGLLYKCTATDTWSLYYTPFTYPHPLNTDEGDPEPAVTGTGRGRTRRGGND
jgi:hypothetical protein